MGGGGITPHVLNLSTKWEWLAPYPWYPLGRRLGGPQSQSGRGYDERKSFTGNWTSSHCTDGDSHSLSLPYKNMAFIWLSLVCAVDGHCLASNTGCLTQFCLVDVPLISRPFSRCHSYLEQST
jgi:hypothetical protein